MKPINELTNEKLQLENLDNIIRTGINVDNGDSFFTAYSLAYKDYRNSDNKLEYVVNKRKEFADKMDIFKWNSCLNILKEYIIETFKITLYNIESLYENKKVIEEYDIKVDFLKTIFDLLTKETIDENVFNNLNNLEIRNRKHLEKEISDIMFKLIDTEILLIEQLVVEKDKMKDTKKKLIIDNLIGEFIKVINYCLDYSYKEYKNEIKKEGNYLSIEFILCLLNQVDNCNIVLIDSSTLYPNYEYLNNININNEKPFIFLLYFPDYHYESIGIEQGNRLYRIFSSKDEIVKNFFSKD